MNVVGLIFLLLALLWVLYCFLPGWSGPPTLSVASAVRCIIGLVVLFMVYLIVMALFAAPSVRLP